MADAEIFKVPMLPSASPTSTEQMNSDDVKLNEASNSTLTKTDTLIRHKNLQYKVPNSSAIPPIEYTFEVLRNGTIIQNIELSTREYTVFGRSPDSDIVLEHPTISRYHAIVQYKSEFEHGQSPGLYLYDCASTHGTFINKKRIESNVYVRIKIGYVIKFGQSTRLYLVQGDSAAESDAIDSSTGDNITHEQMKEFHAKRAKKLADVRAKRENIANETNNNYEMDWGMGPDSDEPSSSNMRIVSTKPAEDDIRQTEEENKRREAALDLKNRLEYQNAKNDQAVLKDIMTHVGDLVQDEENDSTKEPFYLKDPKRALTTFFEREGAELVYDVEDLQFGSYRCTIKLPIIDEYGHSIQAEAEQKHCKRKEIIQQCILEACRILDEHDVLREGTAASSLNTPRIQQLKRQMLEENDFYEDDEDTFYDRTGELEKKRLKRMERSGHLSNEKQIETFDSLCTKLTNIYKERIELENKLESAKEMEDNAAKSAARTDQETDELDLYIRQLKQGEKINIKVKWQWQKRILEIENEERQYAKLLKVCKPKEFDIQTWKQKILEEEKLNLKSKKSSIPRPPIPVIQTMPLIPSEKVQSPSSSTSCESKSIESTEEGTIAEKDEDKPKPTSVKPKPKTYMKSTRRINNSKDQYDDTDHYSSEKFSDWMPPENEQTGDGRTALNDKYGY